MGVRKKYKRKMIRSNRLFYWYVEPDIDDEGIIKLHIIYMIAKIKTPTSTIT